MLATLTFSPQTQTQNDYFTAQLQNLTASLCCCLSVEDKNVTLAHENKARGRVSLSRQLLRGEAEFPLGSHINIFRKIPWHP